MASNIEVEPGATKESVLIPSECLENFDHMSSSLEEIKSENNSSVGSTYEESNFVNSNTDNFEDAIDKEENGSTPEYDLGNSTEWTSKNKHIFVLSSAGKPIYSRHGNEDKLAWLFGVMQALVSNIQSSDDTLKSIHAGDTLFVFMNKKPLILVAVSKTGECVNQLTLQLNYVFNQITSMLTLTRLNKIYEQRQNYDLRRLLAGGERLIDHLLDFSEKEPAFFLGAVQCLPLASSVRDSISSAIIGACHKIKNLVFAILLAKNRLITLVRMKKYYLHPSDLHLIFNLVQSSESLKYSQHHWTPFCLPRFDASGFLYAHVSYLADDCQACLLLLTVERDVCDVLSEAKQKIVEKLRRNNCLEPINESIATPEETAVNAGFAEIRHYLYKCKSTAQFYQPSLAPPYSKEKMRLIEIYKRSNQQLHNTARPLKLIFERSANEAIFSWDTTAFELYVVFEPLIDIACAIDFVTKLLNWVKKREDKLFHLNAPTF
ncbi:vacuolar fusion protein MON1 homolog A [Sitophilus oryzae]|uniref:Vacuolar fusion protein MON1 homolog n=1 Tax=Sitophilus oryzae TaxID=7048 RepID=A0A6J2YNY5_SITOR|nr:vacuolar fusion protein MON1 homolog A [Sitophilus oryzae]